MQWWSVGVVCNWCDCSLYTHHYDSLFIINMLSSLFPIQTFSKFAYLFCVFSSFPQAILIPLLHLIPQLGWKCMPDLVLYMRHHASNGFRPVSFYQIPRVCKARPIFISGKTTNSAFGLLIPSKIIKLRLILHSIHCSWQHACATCNAF